MINTPTESYSPTLICEDPVMRPQVLLVEHFQAGVLGFGDDPAGARHLSVGEDSGR
jgi:hypothetical protein